MSIPPHDEHGCPRLLAGRYELGTTLGRGGMADVYRAVDRLLSRSVAVKVLRETAADESDRARFVTEARTLARLSHSGLVTILDAGFGSDGRDAATPPGPSSAAMTPDRPFLVMELVDGPSLAQAIADGPLPLDQVGSIGVQVAQALAYVHAHGVIHRDVKPGNVLLGGAHQVRLTDFGIARLLDDSARHTRTGHTIGTAAYLAPEQVTGQDVSGAADVYALGLVLLEAITGRLEYPGPATEAAVARLSRPPRVPDQLPAPWRQLLSDMAALDPAQRPDAALVAERLRDQPTGPIPVPSEGSPDARTQPLLATAARTETASVAGDGAPSTRVLTAKTLAAGTSPPARETSVIDRAGDSLAGQPGRLAARLRAMTPWQRGGFGGLVVLAVVLLVVAVVGVGGTGGNGGDGSTDIPSNTPAELRAPLQELHRAVNGDDG